MGAYHNRELVLVTVELVYFIFVRVNSVFAKQQLQVFTEKDLALVHGSAGFERV